MLPTQIVALYSSRLPAVAAETWAILASLINTAKLHDFDPRHYLTDVLERIVSGRTKINQLHTLLP